MAESSYSQVNDSSWELWSVLNGGDLRIDDISDDIDIAQLTTEDPEGPCKFYNYLLLHPSRLHEIVPPYTIKKFRTFVESVFYVGKGTELRFLDHFKEARANNSFSCQGQKIKCIRSIWDAGQGVVILKLFVGQHERESYTREYCMVEAIGTGILTNDRRGLRIYGVICNNWNDEGRRRLGVYLLHEAYLQYTYQRYQCSQSVMGDDPRLIPSVLRVRGSL